MAANSLVPAIMEILASGTIAPFTSVTVPVIVMSLALRRGRTIDRDRNTTITRKKPLWAGTINKWIRQALNSGTMYRNITQNMADLFPVVLLPMWRKAWKGVYFNYLFADFRASSSDALKMLYDQVAPVTASTFMISWDSSNFLG